MPFLDAVVLGRSIGTWLLAALVAIGALGLALVLRGILSRRLASFARTTKTAVDDVIAALIGGTRPVFLAALAALAGALVLGGEIERIAGRIAILVGLFQAVLWAQKLIAVYADAYGARKAVDDPGAATTIRAVGFVARLAVWSLGLILALDNLGVDVTALVAGLGVGGIAVALAVQNVLGDLFASLSIVLDKPFVQGDFIIVGDLMGTVDHVGLKTTRVRSLGGEQIIFSNADLLGSRIRNYKRMAERRVVFGLSITHGTPQPKLEWLAGRLRAIAEAQPKVRFDRAHFKAFGAYSLDFEVVYYVLDPDYNLYMDIQQRMNFQIVRELEAGGIALAYPTQSIHIVPAPGSAAVSETAGMLVAAGSAS